uniref:Small integral membrane protein 8 n=1 Tax=Schistocephalus solidus TaxID=70667 RepID=A0A0X3PWM9_SCHSO
MFSSSLYFPRLHPFNFSASIFTESDNFDEERVIAEAETSLQHVTSQLTSSDFDQALPTPRDSRAGRTLSQPPRFSGSDRRQLNTTRSSFGTPVEEDEDDEGEEEYDEVSASSPINISDLGETLPRTAQGLNSLDHSGASNLRLGDFARGQFSASIPRNVAATSPSAFSPPSSSQRALEHYPSSAAMNHLFEEITRTIEVEESMETDYASFDDSLLFST